MAMAALYALNIYIFGDPNETDIPFFLEKHMANHLGSTLFYYVAANAKYQMYVRLHDLPGEDCLEELTFGIFMYVHAEIEGHLNDITLHSQWEFIIYAKM